MICQTCGGWGFVDNPPAGHRPLSMPARAVCPDCKGKAADIIPGDRVFWPGIADGVPMIRSGFIEGHRGPKFRICDDSGIRFTKSARALYRTRAAADAALHRMLLRMP